MTTSFVEREEFCIKIIHKAAYFLDPREHGMLLCDEEKVAAIEFMCGLAETFSSCEFTDCRFIKTSSRWLSVFSKGWVLCYAFFVEKY